jgi:hypothetical protein
MFIDFMSINERCNTLDGLISDVIAGRGGDEAMCQVASLSAPMRGCLRLAEASRLFVHYLDLEKPSAKDRTWSQILSELSGAQTEVSRYRDSMSDGG